MNRQTNNVIRALLQGFTGAGLFRRLNYPGAPTEFVSTNPFDVLQVDPKVVRASDITLYDEKRTDHPDNDELFARLDKQDKLRNDARQPNDTTGETAKAHRK